jgi:hypothetical protein
MLQKLRHMLLSLPVLTAAGLFALYLGVGFWGLPALVKWQGEKLVREKLGQNLTLTDIRFNPLVFKLEVRNLALPGKSRARLQDVELGVTALSLSAPGGTAPLLAVEKMGLQGGRVDLGQRQVNASTNAQGRLDWTTLVHPSADTPPEPPAGAPWRVSIANTTVAAVADHFQDARQGLRAKVQLDARVDQYGSAKIGGQISLLSPEKLTEIDMVFRNLEMSSLSPYVVRFAGYRVAGGRLWLAGHKAL